MTKILVDCDPGHDDAIALLLALASPELELAGVTTVSGNQTVEKTTRNARTVLELAGHGDVPVARGADRPLLRERFVAAYVHGESGLDGPNLPEPEAREVDQHAVDFLAERIDGATLVAVGPLTNVALLLARYPHARPERLVIMGGSIAEGNVTPAAEFNIWADPEAARRVFESGLEPTMIGLDVTHEAKMTRAHAERMREAGSVGRVVAEFWDFFSRYHVRTHGSDDSPIHDALCVALLLRPKLVELAHRHIAIETESALCRGRTVVDLWRRTGNEPNAHVGVGVDGAGFMELLIERIATLG